MSAVDFHGRTTIVTGASAGIGAEFARQLAARGSHLVLVARRLDRLERLAAELRAAHGVQVTPVALDLAAPGAGRALAGEVDRLGLEVTGLVNNAGFGTHGPFHAEDPDRVQEEIAVNVAALVDLSHAFVGRLREAGTGILVNVASLIAYQPAPGMAVYGATKAFVLSFTEALWQESRGTGLRVLALSPGATSTEFFDVLGARVDSRTGTQTPAQVVAAALGALDRQDGPPSVVPGRVNALLSRSSRLLTRRGTLRVMATMTRPA